MSVSASRSRLLDGIILLLCEEEAGGQLSSGLYRMCLHRRISYKLANLAGLRLVKDG